MNKPEIFLKNAIKKNRLPQIMLFTGTEYDIKFSTAIKLMTKIFCKEKSIPYGCQKCFICKQILSQKYPYVQILTSGLEKKLEIDRVKELSIYSNRISWIIPQAHFLTKQAGDVLSKKIDFLAEDQFFIFIAPHSYMLTPSLFSKCNCIFFKKETSLINTEEFTSNPNLSIPNQIIDRLNFIEKLIKNKTDILELLKYWSLNASKEFKEALLRAEIDIKLNINKQLVLESLLLTDL